MLAGIEVNFSLIVNIIRTLIDLLLVWYILYLGISMFKQNMRTMQLFKGVLIILLIKLVTSVLGLSTMSYFCGYGFNVGYYCHHCYFPTRNSFFT